MKKRIVPELFRNNVYYNYFNLNYLGFTKNINSILLYQDIELKKYIKDFFSQSKLDIHNIALIRNQNILTINVYFIKKLIQLTNLNENLFEKLNFYKYYTLQNMEQLSIFDVSTIVSRKIFKIIKGKKIYNDYTLKEIGEYEYGRRFFSLFELALQRSGGKNKHINYQYLKPMYDYMYKLKEYILPKRKNMKDQEFWDIFNDMKESMFFSSPTDNTDIRWYKVIFSQRNYPFFRLPIKPKKEKTIPLVYFLPHYFFNKKNNVKKKKKIRVTFVKNKKGRVIPKFIVPSWFKYKTKTAASRFLAFQRNSKKEKESKIKKFYKKINYFIKNYKNLIVSLKDYFDYMYLPKIPYFKLNEFKIIKPKFTKKIKKIYKYYFKNYIKNFKCINLKKKSNKKEMFKIIKMLSKKIKYYIYLYLNIYNINKYLYYKYLFKILMLNKK